MEQDNNIERPFSLPTAWPNDKRSKLSMMIGHGWVLSHPERNTMLYVNDKWEEIDQERKVS